MTRITLALSALALSGCEAFLKDCPTEWCDRYSTGSGSVYFASGDGSPGGPADPPADPPAPSDPPSPTEPDDPPSPTEPTEPEDC